MGNYTEYIDGKFWGEFYPEGNNNLQDIIDFLNSNNFRSFGDGLAEVIRRKYPEKEGMLPLEVLRQCCQEKGIAIAEIGSANTLKAWFNKDGERPKKGDGDRQKMFVCAFALGLDVEETKYLFNHVFLDRAFNFRNVQELIYYHCIRYGKDYHTACAMIKEIKFVDRADSDATVLTQPLMESMPEDDAALIGFINSHPHNFEIKNKSAKRKLEELLDAALADIATETQYEQISESAASRKVAAGSEITKNVMFEHITGADMDKSSGTSSIFKNARLPSEIKRSFPEAVSFSKKEPTADELRKMIIFLFSYSFWCRMQYRGFQKGIEPEDIELDDYIQQLDSLLESLGFSRMYAGNPHDWLYCYCSTAVHPLDIFRELLGEALAESTEVTE